MSFTQEVTALHELYMLERSLNGDLPETRNAIRHVAQLIQRFWPTSLDEERVYVEAALLRLAAAQPKSDQQPEASPPILRTTEFSQSTANTEPILLSLTIEEMIALGILGSLLEAAELETAKPHIPSAEQPA